ncbi:hypothetical protein [Flavihumibacter sp. UBA7668]|uniref:hypothetical protein n=1 Tax=Flavihumibacter sp. UBA7668 TaxID=1946542 RepID=UPI0025BF6CE9|nr:hypothetical protein [Flavihumibacter sp. UBA7668]
MSELGVDVILSPIMQYSPVHRFHIPVMGLAFTIDTPIKVARYGISSVISIVEDKLVEMMRQHYYPTANKEYFPISTKEPDYRAKRITDYLNLVHSIVQTQVEKLKASAFETGSEIVKYFELLPENNTVKQLYRQMVKLNDPFEKLKLEEILRSQIRAGSIDVNIMTKVDRDNFINGELITDGSDAVSALRGYANSKLTNSSVVFSAGLNPRLYNYLSTCSEFNLNECGDFNKKIIVKVSDYRSALIQGKYLAKKGLWVSEFRIESGLNCGGHAFATDGILLGPILEEFKTNKQELIDSLFEIYQSSIFRLKQIQVKDPAPLAISVQGGIGTAEEDQYLHEYYKVDSTGWGTPFLLVPEATTVDQKTLDLLSRAGEADLELSRNSPLGIRFHYLKGTSSHKEKLERIRQNKAGSPCTEKHLAFNTEFTKEPICTASKKYQQLKLEQLQSLKLPTEEYNRQKTEVLDKECLCIGLSNSAAINYKQTLVKKLDAVTICPGPNIVNFSRQVSLQKMIDHIYGRDNILTSPHRPHMFIAELYLYIDFLKEKLTRDLESGLFQKNKNAHAVYYQHLLEGISYYQTLPRFSHTEQESFRKALELAVIELDCLNIQFEFQ